MRLDRLLAIMMCLFNETRISATGLSGRLGVSLRTVYRDMETILRAGIPIVSFPGADGGYEIESGYRAEKKLLSLHHFVSVCSALHGTPLSAESEEIEDLIAASSGISQEDIRALIRAAHGLRIVSIDYRDSSGSETKRTVEPHGLFMKYGSWYMYGYCRFRSDTRIFKLSRICRLDSSMETFCPRSITLHDVDQQFQQVGRSAKLDVALLFCREAETRVRDEFQAEELTVLPDNGIQVTGRYSSMETAVRHILSYGEHARVQHPPWLIAELKSRIAAMGRIY
ncbi:helix-turn-helix transcriptional regulator [Paenibacillus harenae]|uniref:helix-turn-helix transcriptional regulator n=1 Tax=Paenibacillus harenae TaxID=306543 RepID=UPI0003F8B8FE|nr:YafY family protein [Paenibacillus harenae]